MTARGSKKAGGSAPGIAKVLGALYRAEKAVAALAFGVMTLLVIADIFMREVFGRSFPLGPKLAIFLMIWGGFLGASLTSAKGAHLKVDAAMKLWPKRLVPAVETVDHLLTTLFCGFMAWLSIDYVRTSRELGELAVVVDVPLWIIQLVIPYTFVSMTLRHALYVALPSIRPVVTVEDLK